MGYSIICDARKGEEMGITTLGLVDRNKCKSLWWTSDNPNLLMVFRKKPAAQYTCDRLRMNNCRVVESGVAISYLTDQSDEIDHHKAMSESEMGWDAHKECL